MPVSLGFMVLLQRRVAQYNVETVLFYKECTVKNSHNHVLVFKAII